MLIPSVSLIDIEPGSGTISLVYTQPTEAGQPITSTSATDNSRWINYTSANYSSITRKITVQIASGNVPAGTVVDLTASAYSGGGSGGTFGTPNSTIQLSTATQDLITGISSCFTGDGTTSGHCLTFGLRITDYANVKTLSAGTLVISYTFIDN